MRNLDADLLIDLEIKSKVRGSDVYAQHLYAALCNNEWMYQEVLTVLKDQRWSCSWRYAGCVIADLQDKGDYMDWYCSGMQFYHDSDGFAPTEIEQQYVPEGMITDEVRADLLKIGWVPVDQ